MLLKQPSKELKRHEMKEGDDWRKKYIKGGPRNEGVDFGMLFGGGACVPEACFGVFHAPP